VSRKALHHPEFGQFCRRVFLKITTTMQVASAKNKTVSTWNSGIVGDDDADANGLEHGEGDRLVGCGVGLGGAEAVKLGAGVASMFCSTMMV
jgi:hypothetical protein